MPPRSHRRQPRSLAAPAPARYHRHWLSQLAFVVMLIGLMVAIGGAQASAMGTASGTAVSPEGSSAEQRSPEQ